MHRRKRLRITLLTAFTLLAAGALAGCVGGDEEVNEDVGPRDETGSPRDAEDTLRGEEEPDEPEGEEDLTDPAGEEDEVDEDTA